MMNNTGSSRISTYVLTALSCGWDDIPIVDDRLPDPSRKFMEKPYAGVCRYRGGSKLSKAKSPKYMTTKSGRVKLKRRKRH